MLDHCTTEHHRPSNVPTRAVDQGHDDLGGDLAGASGAAVCDVDVGADARGAITNVVLFVPGLRDHVEAVVPRMTHNLLVCLTRRRQLRRVGLELGGNVAVVAGVRVQRQVQGAHVRRAMEGVFCHRGKPSEYVIGSRGAAHACVPPQRL